MTSRVLRSLRDAGIASKYQVVDLYRQGQGKQVLAIIAISEPVPSRTDFLTLDSAGGPPITRLVLTP